MGKKKKNRIQTENPEPLAFRPFEGVLPSGDDGGGFSDPSSKSSKEDADALPELKGVFSLRKEKKGRGGKTVTLVSGNCLSEKDAEKLARALRKALGCGSRVEENMVLLQGDLRERTELWLLAHGAKRVVVG